MSKPDDKALRRAIKGASVVVHNPRTERVAAWWGGSCVSIYDYGGALVDTVGSPLGGTAKIVRKYCLRLLGKGAGHD